MKNSILTVIVILAISSPVLAENYAEAGKAALQTTPALAAEAKVTTEECSKAFRETIMAGFDDIAAHDRAYTREIRTRCKYGALFFRYCAEAYLNEGDFSNFEFSMTQVKRVEEAQFLGQCKN